MSHSPPPSDSPKTDVVYRAHELKQDAEQAVQEARLALRQLVQSAERDRHCPITIRVNLKVALEKVEFIGQQVDTLKNALTKAAEYSYAVQQQRNELQRQLEYAFAWQRQYDPPEEPDLDTEIESVS